MWCFQVNDLTNCNKKQWCLASERKTGLIRERWRQSSRIVGPGEKRGSGETSDHRSTLKENGSSIDLVHSLLSADIWSLFLFTANSQSPQHTHQYEHISTHTLFCALIHSYARSRQHGHTRSDRTPSCTNKCSIMMLNPLSLLFDESVLKEQAAMMWSNNPVPLFALRASR